MLSSRLVLERSFARYFIVSSNSYWHVVAVVVVDE
jgi:hypothetical protein